MFMVSGRSLCAPGGREIGLWWCDVGPIWSIKEGPRSFLSLSFSLFFFLWKSCNSRLLFWVTIYSIWQNIKSVCTTKIADYIYRQTICLVLHVGETTKKIKNKRKKEKKKESSQEESSMAVRFRCVSSLSLAVSVQIIFGILTFRCWHEWKITKMRAHWTEQPCKKKKKKKRLVPLFVSSHRGMAAVFFFLFFYPSASSLCADTNCRLRWKLHGGDPGQRRPPPRQSIFASSPDVGRSTSENSRACSCWPACLLLWKRPRRPRSEGWSGSAGTETLSPGWGRSRARCRLAWAASWTLTSCSGTKSLPAGERGRA